MKSITKIISGGQSGADYGGILFAKKAGVTLDINVFEEFFPINGEQLPAENVHDVVNNKSYYNEKLRARTLYNVLNSDITLIFMVTNTGGTRLTIRYLEENSKPYVVFHSNYTNFEFENSLSMRNAMMVIPKLVEQLGRGLVVNIAGSRRFKDAKVVEILTALWSRIDA